MSRKAYLCGASIAGLIATSVGNEAWAQPSAESVATLDAVVVTARRKEESLQSVPVAVTAVTGEQMRQEHIVKTEDLQRVTPSLTVTSTIRGNSTPGYAIRGLRTFDVATSTDPSVTLYFDEYGVTRNTGSNQSMFDLESVQVLKGPQGTLFGRNTTGGAVLVTPRSPTNDFGGYVQGAVGNYNLRDFEGVINLPLSDKLAIRAGLKYTKRDGYFENVITGQKLNDANALGARLYVLWRPTDEIESRTIALYFNNDSNGTGVKLDRVVPAGVPAPFRAALTPLLNQELALANSLGKYEFRSNVRDYFSKDDVYGLQNRTEWRLGDTALGDLTVKNIIGLRIIRDKYQTESDGSNLQLIDFPGRIETEQWSEEFQIQAVAGRLSYVLGAFYFQEKSTDQADSFQFGAILPPTVPNLPVLQDFDSKNISYAAFAHIDFDLSDMLEGLSISAGLRYTHDKRTVTPRSRNQIRNAATGVITYSCAQTGVINASSDRLLCGTPATATADEPTWDVSLNYQVNPDTLLYVAHRHGYKAGGVNPRPSPATGIVPYAPEKVNDLEFGLKKDFRIGEMAGRLNVAAFYTWLTDAQRNVNIIRVVNGAPTASSLIFNSADAHIYGGEVELTLRPTDSLYFNLGYSLVKPKYDTWNDTVVVGGVTTLVDISDSQFSYTPENQLSARVRYTLPLDEELGEATLQASWYYQSSMWLGDINSTNCGPGGAYLQCLNADAKVSGYSLVNLRAEWRRPFGSPFDVAAFVNNVGDKYYKNFGFMLLGSIGTRAVGIGEPRTFGVELRVPFGAEE